MFQSFIPPLPKKRPVKFYACGHSQPKRARFDCKATIISTASWGENKHVNPVGFRHICLLFRFRVFFGCIKKQTVSHLLTWLPSTRHCLTGFNEKIRLYHTHTGQECMPSCPWSRRWRVLKKLDVFWSKASESMNKRKQAAVSMTKSGAKNQQTDVFYPPANYWRILAWGLLSLSTEPAWRKRAGTLAWAPQHKQDFLTSQQCHIFASLPIPSVYHLPSVQLMTPHPGSHGPPLPRARLIPGPLETGVASLRCPLLWVDLCLPEALAQLLFLWQMWHITVIIVVESKAHKSNSCEASQATPQSFWQSLEKSPRSKW